MPPSTAAFITGFCGGRNPESHTACRGSVTQGSAVGGTLNCTCTCHTDQREVFLREMFEYSAWRTVDRATGETIFHANEAQARAYAKTKEPACGNCNGTGAVPAGGWESEDEVDNGYTACPTCSAGVAGDGLGDVPSVDPAVQPTPAATAGAVLHGDRAARDGRTDHVSSVSSDPVERHLTATGSERLRTWAVERQEA